MTASGVVLKTELAGAKLFKRGKVRDVYDLGDQLLIVATDRISAFDVVIPTGIPSKGAVLTQISAFWFEKMKDITPHHLISVDIDRITQTHPFLNPHRAVLAGRSMLARKTQVVPIECVVRGYLAGSGWKEYQKSRSVCGVGLPAGLRQAQELPEPIFTPATKEESGHDVNISEIQMAQRVGPELTKQLKTVSLAVYKRARDYARSRGILIADTKFEFGLLHGEPTLIDELLTPDSSRFWPMEEYDSELTSGAASSGRSHDSGLTSGAASASGSHAPGRSPVSFDKQFVRDYLEGLSWDKTPPAPALPEEIVRKISAKYLQALTVLTGRGL